MKLNEIRDNKGANKKSKKLGRGIGSGKGKTAGKGHKGQNARSGVAVRTFEGGQMPIYMRLPKRGFKSINKKIFAEINLSDVQKGIDAGVLTADITVASLVVSGLVKNVRDGVKLLARGEIKSKAKISVCAASEAAKEAVKKAGGEVVLLSDKEFREIKAGMKETKAANVKPAVVKKAKVEKKAAPAKKAPVAKKAPAAKKKAQ